MRAVVIDDERPALDELSFLLRKNSVEVIGAIQNTEGALEFILREKPDMVFLDIEMRGINGIDFGVGLQDSTDNCAVIFVTAYPEYALEAFRAYPLDYIVKPIDEKRLTQTLQHVRETITRRLVAGDGDLYIKCFGKFEVSFGADKVRLPTKKTRELLAYLLCNEGTFIYRNDLTQLIFGSGMNENNLNNLRVSLFRIRSAFQEAGVRKDQFAILEDYTVRIADGSCDLVNFQRFINNTPTITTENIVRAESIAGFLNGDLLHDIDTPWATEIRERIMVQAEEFLINMSIYYLSGGLLEKAEATLLRLIQLNPVSEQGFLRLLDLYILAGDRLKFCCCFERYREMIKKEFGEPPLKMYVDYHIKFAGILT